MLARISHSLCCWQENPRVSRILRAWRPSAQPVSHPNELGASSLGTPVSHPNELGASSLGTPVRRPAVLNRWPVRNAG